MASLDQAFSASASIPARALNGGLYTGEPFAPNAPWGNVPAIPDASYLINHSLRSAKPPPEAIYQYPGHERPGNNQAKMPGIGMSKEPYNMHLIQGSPKDAPCACVKCCMSKYAYL